MASSRGMLAESWPVAGCVPPCSTTVFDCFSGCGAGAGVFLDVTGAFGFRFGAGLFAVVAAGGAGAVGSGCGRFGSVAAGAGAGAGGWVSGVMVGACACGGGIGGFFFLQPLRPSTAISSVPTTMARAIRMLML